MIKWRKSKEFGTGVSRAAPGHPVPVDKSVDNVDNWEFGEFGSLTKRTYRYDYHASSIGWDITR